MPTQASPQSAVQDVEVPAPSGHLQAALALPLGGGRHPAVLLIHEIWGLDGHIRDVAGRLARAGFVTLAPHLYSTRDLGFPMAALSKGLGVMMSLPPERRMDPAAFAQAIAPLPEAERAEIGKAMAWMRARDLAQYDADVRAALGWLRARPDADPARVAAIGFCMGGAVVWRLAAGGAPVWRSVVFYGDNPPLDKVGQVHGPALGLYGGDDARITATVPALEAAMGAAGKPFTAHVYPGVGHAFFNDQRPMYRKEAAEDAWRRVLAFLR
jgi:carboxymethylenebutenolidase